IRSVHHALEGLTREAPAPAEERPKPAVPISKSVQHDYIVCLEDGKKLKMLKRYLRSRYDMSPDEYRRRWGLPPDYPMVAPAYAAASGGNRPPPLPNGCLPALRCGRTLVVRLCVGMRAAQRRSQSANDP